MIYLVMFTLDIILRPEKKNAIRNILQLTREVLVVSVSHWYFNFCSRQGKPLTVFDFGVRSGIRLF